MTGRFEPFRAHVVGAIPLLLGVSGLPRLGGAATRLSLNEDQKRLSRAVKAWNAGCGGPQ